MLLKFPDVENATYLLFGESEAMIFSFLEKETPSKQKFSVPSSSYKLVSSVQDRCNDTSYVINDFNFLEFSSLQEDSTIVQEDVGKDAKA